MKNLITAVACIMLLLSLLLQFSYNQLFFNRIMILERKADTIKNVVKQKGCLPEEEVSNIQKDMSLILECSREDIRIRGDETPVSKGNVITYEIEVPIGKLIVSPFFIKDSDENKIKKYQCTRYVISEYNGGKDEKSDYHNR